MKPIEIETEGLSPQLPLGSINLHIRRSINKVEKTRHIDKEKHLDEMYKRYDEAFCERLDYQVLRLLIHPDYLSHISEGWRERGILPIIENGIESSEPVVFWGALAIISRLLTGERERQFNPETIVGLANLAQQQMFKNMPPVEKAEAECAAIKLLAYDATQKTIYQKHLNYQASFSEILSHIFRLEKGLKEVDCNWSPGGGLNIQAIYNSRKKEGINIAPWGSLDFTLYLINVLFNARGIIKHHLAEINEQSEGLFQEAFLLAYSAWVTAHTLRVTEEKKPGERLEQLGAIDIERLRRNEMQALRRASQAARDAGYHYESGKLAYLLQGTISDQLLSDERFTEVGNDLSGIIRQIGLKVDNRFRKKRSAPFTPIKELNQIPILDANIVLLPNEDGHDLHEESSGIQAQDPRHGLQTNQPENIVDPYLSRIARDKQVTSEWGIVLSHYGADSSYKDPLRALDKIRHDAEKGKLVDESVLKCGFRLCLKYSHIRTASHLIGKFIPERKDLIDFAKSITRISQDMPFGVNIRVHQYWQYQLRRGWKLLERDLAPEEALIIHEAKLGRILSIVKNAKPGIARLIIHKYYDLMDENDVRGSLDSGTGDLLQIPTTISRNDILSFTKHVENNSTLGRPVCASIVGINTKKFSILVTNGEKWESKIFPVPRNSNLYEDTKDILDNFSAWPIIAHHSSKGFDVVPWGRSFYALFSELYELANRVEPNFRLLFLATEPELTKLPLQHLIRSVTPRNRSIIISLVPSFGWVCATLKHNKNFYAKRDLLMKVSNVDDLSDLRRIIGHDKAEHHKRNKHKRNDISTAIIMGHGIPTETNIPSVSVNSKPLELEDWLGLSNFSSIIIHSCYGGYLKYHLLGDLGGLPGLLLGLHCSLICAPPIEIPLQTAMTLHRHLSDALKQRNIENEFCSYYLAAIEEDPAVTLYSLYGLANQALRLTDPRPSP